MLDNTEIVAIAEYNDERRKAVGERFGVKALYKDAEEMYQRIDAVPDLAVTVLPGKFIKDAVIASAPGVVCVACPPISRLALGFPTWTK